MKTRLASTVSCIVILVLSYRFISACLGRWSFAPSNVLCSLKSCRILSSAPIFHRMSWALLCRLWNEILSKSSNRFQVRPNTLYWVSNYEKTRWFLVFSVQRPVQDHLNRLLRLSNDSLRLFDQPPLYAGSRSQGQPTRASSNHRKDDVPTDDFSGYFHISLAWTLSEPSARHHRQVTGIDLRGLRELQIGFDSVKAKVGNNVTSIPLDSSLGWSFQSLTNMLSSHGMFKELRQDIAGLQAYNLSPQCSWGIAWSYMNF
jgi:hypothetical protein